ncbi:hypothetical protein DFH09DRAFT_1120430 [Mycena vulgaris]|nr:hypothetical protein DFH09DRAFT_1120430 [Mycena vulgaris]
MSYAERSVRMSSPCRFPCVGLQPALMRSSTLCKCALVTNFNTTSSGNRAMDDVDAIKCPNEDLSSYVLSEIWARPWSPNTLHLSEFWLQLGPSKSIEKLKLVRTEDTTLNPINGGPPKIQSKSCSTVMVTSWAMSSFRNGAESLFTIVELSELRLAYGVLLVGFSASVGREGGVRTGRGGSMGVCWSYMPGERTSAYSGV